MKDRRGGYFPAAGNQRRVTSAPARLQEGVALHQAGRLDQARAIYEQILASQPRHFDALHLLGVIAAQTSNPRLAADLIGKAIEINPAHAAAHNNYGNALRHLGQPQAAVKSYERATALNPGYAEAFNNCGSVLLEMGRTQAALASYDRAIALNRNYAEAFNGRGKALLALKRPKDALDSHDRAIASRPGYPDAFVNRGMALLALERPKDALASFDRAIALAPTLADAFYKRGNALLELGQPQAALESYDQAIVLKPDLAEAFTTRGNALRALGQSHAAMTSYDRAIALKPDSAEAFYNRGTVLLDMGQPQAALESYDRAIALKPDLADAHINRGVALRNLKRLDAALQSYDQALVLRPDHPDACLNKALAKLLLGDFEDGWPLYEWRRAKTDPGMTKAFPEPVWTGIEEIRGKTLFVHCEQGLGDTIQFCRYLLLAEARGARVVVSVQDRLQRLLKTLSPTVGVIGANARPERFDYHIALLSMPRAFGTMESLIPARVPYLAAEPGRVNAWKQRLGDEGFKIGIAWQGNPQGSSDARFFSIDNVAGLARLPDVRLVSLHKDDAAAAPRNVLEEARIVTPGHGFDDGPDGFIDTAAVMENLDLVITADTSIAHLAGALGRPTWVALKHVPDWRWLLDRSDSPWYPTMRLFRQPSLDDWPSVFGEIETELQKHLAARREASMSQTATLANG